VAAGPEGACCHPRGHERQRRLAIPRLAIRRPTRPRAAGGATRWRLAGSP
jgi:hypothetical protein